LFDIKLSCGKLVTQSFQHRQKNGVARKTAIEFMPHAKVCSEAIDFAHEMGGPARASGTPRRNGAASAPIYGKLASRLNSIVHAR
jgi:hypothetical protein